MRRLLEFVSVFVQYARTHPVRYALKRAYGIAILGQSF